jgi:hypothetical protein
MSINYPLSMPTSKRYAEISLHEVNIVTGSQSIYSARQYFADLGGKYWMADVAFPPLKDPYASELEGFISALNGRIGTFYLPFLQRTAPNGVATGTPVVDGADQTGITLATRGWTSNITGIMKAGDYFRLGDYAYKAVQDADSDGNGDASLEIWPHIKGPPSDGATIYTTNVYGLFRLAANEVMFSANAAKIFGFSFSAIEAI